MMPDTFIEILLVEDSPDDLELTLDAMEEYRASRRLHAVRDGAEALDFLFCRGAYRHRSIDHPPRLVLIDLKLPRVDGIEVLRQVKADPRTRRIPVVVMSASDQDADRRRSYDLGANSYVRKHIDYDCSRKTVKALVHYWLYVNLPPFGDAVSPTSRWNWTSITKR